MSATLNPTNNLYLTLMILVAIVWFAGLLAGVYYAVRREEPRKYSRTLHLVAGLLAGPIELVLAAMESTPADGSKSRRSRR